MDLTLSKAQQQLLSELRTFIAREGRHSPQVGGGRKKPSQRVLDWQRLLIEHGYAARNIPREYGGYGAPFDPIELALISEEFSKAGIFPGIMNQGTHMLAPTLLELGTEEQRRKWIGPAVRGEMIWSAGLSEREAGSDLRSLKTMARFDGSQFVLDGEKAWISSAHYADMLFVLCRAASDQASKTFMMLLVPISAPGIEIERMPTITARAEFNIVSFRNVRVPAEHIIQGPKDGWRVALTTFRNERAGLGGTYKLVQRLTRIATLMKELPRTAPGYAGCRDRLLRLQGAVFAWRAHGMRVISSRGEGDEKILPLIVKHGVTDLEYRLSSLALDILGTGSLGYEPGPEDAEVDGSTLWNLDNLYDLGLLIGGGSANIQKNTVAEQGLGMPPEPRLERSPLPAGAR
jgi:alkylation response protein AidB-like acyl-CoA dehydrogenase